MGTRFDCGYRRSAFDCGRRNNAFDVHGAALSVPATFDAQSNIHAHGATYPPSTYTIPAWEPPISWVAGQDKFFGAYDKYRLHMSVTAPSKKPVTARFKFSIARPSGGGAFTLNLYRSDVDLRPIDVGDWGHLDTLEDSLDVSTIPADGVARYYYFDLDVDYFTDATELTYILVSSLDESNTPPTGKEYVTGYSSSIETT